MQRRRSPEPSESGPSPFKLLLWTAIAGLIFGVIGFGEVLENTLRVGRNGLHPHHASGDIVLIAIDDKSLQDLGNWPWPRRTHARLLDRLGNLGARRVFYDINFSFKSNAADDTAFEAALARSRKVTLPTQFLTGVAQAKESKLRPLPRFRKHTKVATISLEYNYQNAAWMLPYAWTIDRTPVQSFAASLANASGPPGQSFRIDYSLDPQSIPTVSASDVLNSRQPLSQIAGKDVVIGITAAQLGDQYFIPGRGKMGGVYSHLFGAETLKAGIPIDLGWLMAFALSLALATFAVLRRKANHQTLILSGAAGMLLLAPVVLETRLIFVDITPGLFVLAIIATSVAWRRFRQRGVVNPVTGLPNLTALRSDRGARSRPLIVARVHNYAEIASTLPQEDERLFVDQIVGRLSIGSPTRNLYQGDEGIFAWSADPESAIGDHLEALHALFRNPARIGSLQIDLSISFGVEQGSSRSLANRIGSALVAADEAAVEGIKWKKYDPEKLKDVAWKLSLLSQLDAAIESGEV